MIDAMRKEHIAFSKKLSPSKSKRWLSFSFFMFTIYIFFSLLSCASSRDFSAVDASVYYGDFENAQIQVESEKNKLYGKSDKVLYGLDAGMLSRYGGDYEQSNLHLSQAEKLIEEYFAISITQTIGSYVLNDTIIDYAGEDFEDIYTNLFMALNYIQLGNTEAAFVEIRRFNNKLQLLSTKYVSALEDARQHVAKEGLDSTQLFNEPDIQTLSFYDSAFARYVSLLLYRSNGQMDSAAIDKKFIETAFLTQPQLYPFPIPQAVEEEFTIPNNKERLNVFAYTGRAPEKIEEVLHLPNVVNNTWFKLALPIMVINPSPVASIHFSATNQNGATFSGNLQKLESIENIAIDTFQQKQGLLYLKTLVRAVSKTIVNEGVTSAIQDSDAAGWAALFNVAANVFTEISEQADIRSSRYFPASVWIGGLNLDKGLYTVEVIWYDAYNRIIHKEIKENVSVKSNNVNLVEAVCLQ